MTVASSRFDIVSAEDAPPVGSLFIVHMAAPPAQLPRNASREWRLVAAFSAFHVLTRINGGRRRSRRGDAPAFVHRSELPRSVPESSNPGTRTTPSAPHAAHVSISGPLVPTQTSVDRVQVTDAGGSACRHRWDPPRVPR